MICTAVGSGSSGSQSLLFGASFHVDVIIAIFFAVALVLLFVFFLVWLLSKEDIGNYRPIRRVCVGTCWMHSAHV